MSALRRLAPIAAIMLTPALAWPKPPVEFRIGSIAPEGTAWVSACINPFALQLQKHGLHVKQIHGASLGDEQAQIDLLRRGKLQAYSGSLAALAEVVPELNAFELPYLFENDAEVDAVFRSDAGALARKIARAAGIELFGIAEVGWRNFGGKTPIRAPSDLEGVVVRSQENPLHEEMWRLLGAKPKRLPVTLTLAALETGLVAALDQSPAFLFATSWYHHTPHYTLSRHIYQAGVIFMDRKVLDRLPAVASSLPSWVPAAERACVKACREESAGVMRELARENVKLIELSAAERDAFRQRLLPLRATFRRSTTAQGRALLDSIEKALADYRRGGR